MPTLIRPATGVAVLAALIFAAPGGAATRQVLLGEQAKPPAGTPKGTTLNQFFPEVVQVNVGDQVKFTSRSFHTASALGSAKAPPLFLPDATGATYAGITDSLGQPFFFNSLPKLTYNVAAFAPGGKTVPGTGIASTGVLSPGPNGKPVSGSLTFTKTGTFKVVCTIHPGMTAKVIVKPAGAPVPAQAEVTAQATKATAAAWAKAKALAVTKAPPNTVLAGVGTKTTLFSFLPRKLTVKAGTTVAFLAKAPSEVHNVAFGPEKYIDGLMKKIDFFPMGPGKPNQAPPFFFYGSDPPGAGGAYVYDGRNHGNGFFVTPLTDTQPGLPPAGLAPAARVKFTKAGKYHYFCLLHGPDMAGDIVVTP